MSFHLLIEVRWDPSIAFFEWLGVCNFNSMFDGIAFSQVQICFKKKNQQNQPANPWLIAAAPLSKNLAPPNLIYPKPRNPLPP